MTDPIIFASATPRHALPNLFSAQAQKEFTVNEALARIDTLLHCAIEGEIDEPPATAVDGEVWLVGDAPMGLFTGHAGKLAGRQAGNWIFASPGTGMRVFDKATGQQALFDAGWHRAEVVPTPSGGSVVDVEARAAIAGLISALVATRILPD